LAEAVEILSSSENKVLTISFDIGYESHEAFIRAFKKEFGISPFHFGKCRQHFKGLEKINLTKELYMGIILRKLPEMKAVCFEGFAPRSGNESF